MPDGSAAEAIQKLLPAEPGGERLQERERRAAQRHRAAGARATSSSAAITPTRARAMLGAGRAHPALPRRRRRPARQRALARGDHGAAAQHQPPLPGGDVDPDPRLAVARPGGGQGRPAHRDAIAPQPCAAPPRSPLRRSGSRCRCGSSCATAACSCARRRRCRSSCSDATVGLVIRRGGERVAWQADALRADGLEALVGRDRHPRSSCAAPRSTARCVLSRRRSRTAATSRWCSRRSRRCWSSGAGRACASAADPPTGRYSATATSRGAARAAYGIDESRRRSAAGPSCASPHRRAPPRRRPGRRAALGSGDRDRRPRAAAPRSVSAFSTRATFFGAVERRGAARPLPPPRGGARRRRRRAAPGQRLELPPLWLGGGPDGEALLAAWAAAAGGAMQARVAARVAGRLVLLVLLLHRVSRGRRRRQRRAARRAARARAVRLRAWSTTAISAPSATGSRPTPSFRTACAGWRSASAPPVSTPASGWRRSSPGPSRGCSASARDWLVRTPAGGRARACWNPTWGLAPAGLRARHDASGGARLAARSSRAPPCSNGAIGS